jgi:hypothetical protein
LAFHQQKNNHAGRECEIGTTEPTPNHAGACIALIDDHDNDRAVTAISPAPAARFAATLTIEKAGDSRQRKITFDCKRNFAKEFPRRIAFPEKVMQLLGIPFRVFVRPICSSYDPKARAIFPDQCDG